MRTTADNNKYRSVIDKIVSDTHIAIDTPAVVEILKDLYPKKHKLKDKYHDITPRQFVTSYKHLALQGFIKIFSGIPQGNASGTYRDITNIIKPMVTHVEHPNNNHIYAETIFELCNISNTHKIPTSIKILKYKFPIWTT